MSKRGPQVSHAWYPRVPNLRNECCALTRLVETEVKGPACPAAGAEVITLLNGLRATTDKVLMQDTIEAESRLIGY